MSLLILTFITGCQALSTSSHLEPRSHLFQHGLRRHESRSTIETTWWIPREFHGHVVIVEGDNDPVVRAAKLVHLPLRNERVAVFVCLGRCCGNASHCVHQEIIYFAIPIKVRRCDGHFRLSFCNGGLSFALIGNIDGYYCFSNSTIRLTSVRACTSQGLDDLVTKRRACIVSDIRAAISEPDVQIVLWCAPALQRRRRYPVAYKQEY